MKAVEVALLIVGAVLAGVELARSHLQSLVAWGLLAVAGALLLKVLA